MKLVESDILELERKFKLNLINSIAGIKPANLVGTCSSDGIENLAIFSSVVHLGSNPPLIGLVVRPTDTVPRNSYDNIVDTGFYTINHVHQKYTKNAHYTSAKFSAEVSEFDRCGLTEEYVDDFPAPFVKESSIKMGLELKQQVPIELNGTILVIGEIKVIMLPDDVVNDKGYLNLELSQSIGIGGLNQYYSLTKDSEHPYVRLSEVPNF